jgi:hypothetical protein
VQQNHVAGGSSGDGEKHLPFPFVKQYCHKDCDQLRNPVGTSKDADILQAIDDQHSKLKGDF